MHQWYWSYQYPDFLNSDDEFIEFDSYLVPESDLEDGALNLMIDKLICFSSSANSPTGNITGNSNLPSVHDIIGDPLLSKLEAQYYTGRRDNIYARDLGPDRSLTRTERLELASRYEASGDTKYNLKTIKVGMFKGERHLVYGDNTTKAAPSRALIEVIRNSK